MNSQTFIPKADLADADKSCKDPSVHREQLAELTSTCVTSKRVSMEKASRCLWNAFRNALSLSSSCWHSALQAAVS